MYYVLLLSLFLPSSFSIFNIKDSHCLIERYTFSQKAAGAKTKLTPFVFEHHIPPVGSGLQADDVAVDEPEVVEDAPQPRPHPQRAYASPMVLEDEESPGDSLVEPCGFHHPHHGIYRAIAVDIAHTEPIDRESESPPVGGGVGFQYEVGQGVVLHLQRERLGPCQHAEHGERAQEHPPCPCHRYRYLAMSVSRLVISRGPITT